MTNGIKRHVIIYKDGSVKSEQSAEMSLHVECIEDHLAFQGFNLDYEANGSKSLIESMRAEGGVRE